jgi:UDP-N-acetylmuramyl tripeptide synthase
VDPAGQLHALNLGLPGRANAADAALATAAAHQFAIATSDALAALSGIRSVQGRYSVHHVAGREIQLILAKNPASWMEQLDDMAAGSDPVVIASHGRGADGRDLSWLWDVDFERLRGRPVAVIGERQLDMAVRLSTAGIEPLLATDLVAAVELLPPASRVRVIASYTALQDLRRQLSRRVVR